VAAVAVAAVAADIAAVVAVAVAAADIAAAVMAALYATPKSPIVRQFNFPARLPVT
jgi:hypothetical protein